MGKLIKSMRPGTLVHTSAGTFKNGSEPTEEQAKALKDLGYRLQSTKGTEESAPAIVWQMRSGQIEDDFRARRDADTKADAVARNAAATQPKE